MAYTINKTNGTALLTLNDGVLNTTYTTSLIGRTYTNYGEALNENFIKLLENSANSSAPSNPLTGELWWDSSNTQLKVYNGSAWKALFTATSTFQDVLVTNSIQSSDSSAVTISDNLNITGTLSVDSIDTNTINSSDSTQVIVNDGLSVQGTVVMMSNLPTSDPNNAGQLWNNAGVLTVSAG